MTQISSTFSRRSMFSPRTAEHVASLIREGEKFDYNKWLEQVRDKEAKAKECRQSVLQRNVPEKIETQVDCREASPSVRLVNGRTPIPIGMTRSRRKTSHSSSDTRLYGD
jgi:hypothetical protein